VTTPTTTSPVNIGAIDPQTYQLIVAGVALVLVLIAIAHMTNTGNTSIRYHAGRVRKAFATKPATPTAAPKPGAPAV